MDMVSIAALPKYEAHKNSQVEKIGYIPDSWCVMRLKFIALINSETLPDNTPSKFPLDYVDIGSVSFEHGIEKTESYIFKDAPSRARRKARSGDVVVSTVRTYLKAIAHIDGEASKYIYSTGFAVVSPKQKLKSAYLGYFVKSNAFTEQVDLIAKGMSYPAINSTELSNLYLVCAPINDQTLIANFLDKKTAQIDEAISIKEKQIALLKERKQIIIQKAVTEGLDPNVPMKDSGVDWIGKIPAHWEVIANRALFSERVEPGKEGLPLLSVSIHTGVSSEEVSEEENIRGRVKIEDKTKYILVKTGDIAFNMMRAWQGGIGAVTSDGMVSPAYIVAKPKGAVAAEFFECQYRCPEFIQQMDRYSKGITDFRKRLYWDSFKQLLTVVPPKSEQAEIIQYIQDVTILIETAIDLLNRQIEKLKEYKTTLINSAVTGKIKVTPEMAGAENAMRGVEGA